MVHGGRRGDGGLGLAVVPLAIEDGARQVGVLDAVEVGDEETADAQETEVLDDFVAQGPGANDQHAGGGKFTLIPPVDEAQPVEAIVAGGGEVGGGDVDDVRVHNWERGEANPAVISG